MAKRCLILICFFSYVCFGSLYSQAVSRYNTFEYGVNEGLLQTTIGDIEIDKNNFCWIAFPNGLQKFDGKNFINVKVQPGLPDDKYASFFRCMNGTLLINHSFGISKYNIDTDKFSLVYQPHTKKNDRVTIIGEDSGILYLFERLSGTITAFNSSDFKQLSVSKTGLITSFSDIEERPRFSDNIINGKVAFKINSTLYFLDLRSKKIINKAFIKNLAHSFLLTMKSEFEVLYYDTQITDALQCRNFKTNTTYPHTIKGKNKNSFGRCVIIPWQNKMLMSINNQLFETDNTSKVLIKEVVNFQNEPVAGNASIHQIKEDHFGNLYLQTVTAGLIKVLRNNYPIKYFGTPFLKQNNTLAILTDKPNNRILTGGNNGLLVYDTLQQLVKHIKTVPGLTRAFTPNGIIKTNNGDYIVFAVGVKMAWRLSKNLSTIKAIKFSTELPPSKSYTHYFGNLIANDDTSALFQTQDKLYAVNFNKNVITENQFANAYILTGIAYKNMILSHGEDSLIVLNRQTLKQIKKIPFKEPAGVRCFAADKNGNLYIAGNKGIFKTDTSGRILQQWNKTTGMPDECVYALAFDDKEYMWCSTNKGILRIGTNNQVLQLTKQDGLQENEFNTNVMALAEDGELFFGGTNGVSSFYPSAIAGYNEKTKVLITGIRNGETDLKQKNASWNVIEIELPYHQNALSFDFIAMGNNNPEQYVYQYRMLGVDKEWIQNNDLQTVRYSLPTGSFRFQLYASRQFYKNAQPAKEIKITIHPPFWKTWWFMILLIFCAGAVLSVFLNMRNRMKYEVKLRQLQQEKELQAERERISKDLHDNLGAYANAVLYNTELLEKEKTDDGRIEIINDLKFASKDIITSLRETVWALKKENYTAEECLVRIKNFIHPFAKYYQHIQFKVEGDAPAELQLHYTKALHLVRIIQEAVSNSMKHAGATQILITSEHENERWKLTVKDDGKGFDFTTMKEEDKGNGINNMQHRAAEAGVRLQINAQTGTGTTINILV